MIVLHSILEKIILLEKELFQRSEDKILFDNINLEEIVKKHGTPLYLFSKRKLLENITHLQESFTKYWPDTGIAYSLKNNSIPDVCEIISNKTNLFEISSLAELQLLENIAKKKNKHLNVILTNIYKTDTLISSTLNFLTNVTSEQDNTHNYIAIDSLQDLKNIERIAKEQKKKHRVLIRVNPGIHMDNQKTIFASANPSAKCAAIINDIEKIKELSNDPTISLWLPNRLNKPQNDSAENLINVASKSKYLDLIGIHCHLGSQINQIEYFERFFEVISIFFKLMNETVNNKLKVLDLGGGYPIDYFNDGSVPTMETISKLLSKNLKYVNIKPKIIIESGRYITASAGTLLTSIKIVKESSLDKKIAILDISVYSDLLDILVANWYYESILVNNLPSENSEQKISNWELVGGTNDTLDHLNPTKFNFKRKPRIFPRDLEIEDLIAIKNTGAYTTCFNSSYSGRSHPKKLII